MGHRLPATAAGDPPRPSLAAAFALAAVHAFLDAPPCPEAARAAREVLSLPIQPELTEAEVERVVRALKAL